jgi:Zn-dependent protease with chaperone function
LRAADATEGGDAAGILRACNVEIRTHQLIFALFLLPLLLLFLPGLLGALGIYLLLYLISPVVSAGVLAHFNMLHLLAAMLCGASTIWYARMLYTRDERSVSSRTVRTPSGAQGEVLRNRVLELWSVAGFHGQQPPKVLWFANFNVLARAWDAHGQRHIEVSSSLWERVVRDDRVAKFILAHEIAHLTNRDIPVFRLLAASSTAAHKLLRTMVWLGVFFGGIAACLRFATTLGLGQAPAEALLGALSLVAITVLLLVALPLSEISIRRYGGFIGSLMEMRADIAAALGTSELRHISSDIDGDPTAKGSTLRDLGRSLIAVDLTHLPDGERLKILASTDRLMTPKVRYFAFTLLLAALFPLNPVTYLVWGGAFDHILMTSLVGGFFASSVAMIVHGSRSAVLSWSRALTLATALCFSATLPQFSINDVGYLLSHLAAGITVRGGFGTEPLTAAQLASDGWTTITSVAGKIWKAAAAGAITMSITLCCFGLMALALLARGTGPSLASPSRLAIIPTVTAFILVILTSRDPWRDVLYEAWPLSYARTVSSVLEGNSWLGLCLPSLGAAAAFAVWAAFCAVYRRAVLRDL